MEEKIKLLGNIPKSLRNLDTLNKHLLLITSLTGLGYLVGKAGSIWLHDCWEKSPLNPLNK